VLTHVMLRALVVLALRLTAAFDFEDDEDDAVAAANAPTFFGDDTSGLAVEVEHSFNGGPFSARGKLFYRGGAGARARARASQAKLSGEGLDEFQALLATGGYYTLRLPSLLSNAHSAPVYASVSVCSLMASRFEERLQLNMLTAGQVAGLSYILPKTTTECPTKGLPKLALDEALFNTTVSVVFPEEGPKPLGKVPDMGFLPPAAQQAARQAEGGGEHERGSGSRSEGPRLYARRVELPPAPPCMEVARAEAKEADRIFEDKYWVVRDPEKHYMPAPSPSLKGLRNVLELQ